MEKALQESRFIQEPKQRATSKEEIFLLISKETSEKICRMTNFEQNTPPKIFWDFLSKHHYGCAMDEGFIVCERNNFGIITVVKCQNCNERIPTIFEDATSHQVRLVRKKELEAVGGNRKVALKQGDHIAWHRPYAIWHHGVVTEILEHDQQGEHCWTGICKTSNRCYSSCCCYCCIHSCECIARIKVIEHAKEDKKFLIREKEHDIYACMDVCRFDYSVSFPPEYTVALATETMKRFIDNDVKKSLHELVYDPFGENCEHFARRCKTGSSESGQVKDLQRECGKGFLMPHLRLICLLIWFICEVIVDEETAGEGENSLIFEKQRQKLNQLELGVSIALSVIFLILYLLYVISREIEKIRYPYSASEIANPEAGCCGERCQNYDCCYDADHACLWCCCCLIIFRPFYKCFTGSRECDRCCLKTFGPNCNCYLFSTNYLNVVMRVLIKEVLLTGVPIVTFIVFEVYANVEKFKEPRDRMKALCGFSISLGASLISLVIPIGPIIANSCEIFCIGCCLKR